MAPGVEALITAEVLGESIGFQAVMFPDSLANRNTDGIFPFGVSSRNPPLPLKTCPVGAPPGMSTTSGTIEKGAPPTAPRYSVVLSVPLSETHSGVAGPALRPQGFTRLGSWTVATPGWSATRLFW